MNASEQKGSKPPFTSLRAAGQIAAFLSATEYVHIAWDALVNDTMLKEVIIPRWASIIESDPDRAVERIISDLTSLSEDMRRAWFALPDSGRVARIAVISNLVREYRLDNP